jgi:hypothetical protein
MQSYEMLEAGCAKDKKRERETKKQTDSQGKIITWTVSTFLYEN